MDKFKAWIEDRKNLPIVATAAGLVIVGVALLFLFQLGIIGGSGGAGVDMASSSVGDTSAGGPAGGPPGGPGSMPPGGPAGGPGVGEPGAGGPPAGGPGTPGGGPGGPGGPAAEDGAGAMVPGGVKPNPMLPYRKDPFTGFAGQPTKKQALMAVVPGVRHLRLAPADVRVKRTTGGESEGTATPEVLPPQPYRRVAGVLWNSKVKAILETEGETEIVQPGDISTKGGSRVRVESIQPNCVVLKTLDTATPMTIKVPVAGSIAARQQGNEGNEGGPIYNEGAPPGAGRGPAATGEAPPPGF